jgi:RNA polymerase sigma factor (sigma-70 family)
MLTNSITDAQLIAAIKGKAEERDQALKQFFHNKSLQETVIHYVLNHGGNAQDGEDVYQDTVILFDRGVREGNFKGQSTLTTYFVGIAKWRWVSHKRKFNRYSELKADSHDMPDDTIAARMVEGERRNIIDRVLTELGEKCKKILTFYKLSYSMEEIAEKMGLSSPEMAKKNSYECRKKFEVFVLNNAEYKEVLNISNPIK